MKKKFILIFTFIILTFMLCSCGSDEPLVSLETDNITVNDDGTFQLKGKLSKPNIQLAINDSNISYDIDDDNNFTANLQMEDSFSTGTLTASYSGDSMDLDLKFDTSKYDNTLKIEKELSSLQDQPVVDAMKKIKESGYTATYIAGGEDFTSFIDDVKDDYFVEKVDIDTSKKSIEVTMISKSDRKAKKIEEELSKKLDEGSAWIAAKHYGEAEYGDTFKLHYLMGKIAAYPEDEKTWFLKAECTVYKQDMTCEVTVTGTSENPKVTSFNVY